MLTKIKYNTKITKFKANLKDVYFKIILNKIINFSNPNNVNLNKI